MLTRTNYTDWAALMRVMLQGRHLWDAINVGTDDFTDDRNALEALCKSVPEELRGSIANKTTAKAAWDALKTRYIGVDRVRKAKAKTLRREFDGITFKEGETIDDFASRITRITDQLTILGEEHEEEEIVRKFLEALPDRFEQIAVAIETLLDLEDVSLDELVGRLKATEERLNRTKGRGGGGSGSSGAGKEIDGKLYFTEEQVIARLASRLNINSDGSARRGKAPSGPGKRRGGTGRGKERGKDARSGPPKGGDGGEDDDCCHYCGKSGHWKRECRKRKRDEEKAVAAAANQPQANLAQAEQEAPALYMAMVTPSETVIHGSHRTEQVFLNEHKVVANLDADGERGEM